MTGDPVEFLGLPAGSKVRNLLVDGVPMCPPLVNGDNFVARYDELARPVLALDIATQMGWAHRSSACITSGSINWTERRGETRGDRLWRFHQWLVEIHRATPLSLIAHEAVAGHMQGPAQASYCQFHGVLLCWTARHGIPVRGINPSTLKKAITDSGRAKKPAMIAAVRALGFTPSDDNEADALAVLHWATNLRGKS